MLRSNKTFTFTFTFRQTEHKSGIADMCGNNWGECVYVGQDD